MRTMSRQGVAGRTGGLDGARARIGLLAGAIAGTAALAAPANAQFNYANFDSLSGLSLVGTSLRSGSSLIMTPAQTRVAGAAWYSAAKQPVAGGFEATIQFRITDMMGTGADGFAFVIQNHSASAIGGTGGAMGYGSNQYFDGQTPRGIPNSVAVELDMWNNATAGDWNDLNGNHVSIQSRGLLPNSPDHQYSRGSAPVPTDMSNGAVHTAFISYAPGLMQIYVDNMVTPLVVSNIDLSTLLSLDNGSAWVGLTAATGGANDIQTHEILNFRLNVNIPAPGSAAMAGGLALLAARRRRSRAV